MLNHLLSDSNPTVVANAVAALSDIDELSEKQVFSINGGNLPKLLAALNECTEYVVCLIPLAFYPSHLLKFVFLLLIQPKVGSSVHFECFGQVQAH
jgi:vesicle coat complex subunit